MSAALTSSSPSPAASPRSSFHQPSPRAAAFLLPTQQRPPTAPRDSTSKHYGHSPRRAFNVSSTSKTSTSDSQPRQQSIVGDRNAVAGNAGTIAGYVDAGTQYSPDGFPPTASASNVAATGKPPGPIAGVGAAPTKKRKETAPADSSASSSSSTSGFMSETSAASSGAPPAQHASVQQPVEPQVRADPVRAPTHPAPEDGEPQEARSTHGHSATPKRSRPEPGSLKVMPLKYEMCNPKDLGVLIANMLMELIRINDRIPLRDGRLTRFHSRAPPGISVSDYLQRLIQHATLSPPIMLSMVYYIDRLCTLYPAFTINSLTVHRFLITAATVAAKGLSDSFWTNPTYARIGGIPVSELATLELELLQKVQWKIVPKPEVLEEYYASLVDRTDGYTIEESTGSASDSTSLDEGDVAVKEGNSTFQRSVDMNASKEEDDTMDGDPS